MPETQIYRVLDASLNRAGEGLRIIEDYLRFVLDDAFLTTQMKELRHDFAALAATIPSSDRHAARDTLCDVGTHISTAAEAARSDAADVCTASLKRVEQSLRSIEEFGKLVDASVGRQSESLRYRLYTLEQAIGVGRDSRHLLQHVLLCVLVDGCGSMAAFERMVDELVEARVGMIQLRDKRLNDRELVARARMLVSLTRRRPPAPTGVCEAASDNARQPAAEPGADAYSAGHTLAIINDRADIAAAVHADGVHLGQEDLKAKDARAIVGTRMLIGISTHDIDQARRAVLDGANYLGAGPTFPSQTKNFDAFAGLNYLRQLSAEIRLPTFAIGGISTKNLGEVLTAGISRVAVGAAITNAEKPGCAARTILDMLDASKHMTADFDRAQFQEAVAPIRSAAPGP